MKACLEELMWWRKPRPVNEEWAGKECFIFFLFAHCLWGYFNEKLSATVVRLKICEALIDYENILNMFIQSQTSEGLYREKKKDLASLISVCAAVWKKVNLSLQIV